MATNRTEGSGICMQESEQIKLERLGRLESPERLRELPPELLLDLLAIGEDETILDLGAGGGYFTLPAAGRTKNTVYGVDNDPFMLEVLRGRALSDGASHVEAIEGIGEHIPLAAESVDAAVASLILHIMEEPGQGAAELCRVLKPGGRGLIVEWALPRLDGKPGHRVFLEEMRGILAGQPVDILDVRSWGEAYYSVVFRKRSELD